MPQLRKWKIVRSEKGVMRIRGLIYNDTTKRFFDGEQITTSKPIRVTEDGEIITKSSIAYELLTDNKSFDYNEAAKENFLQQVRKELGLC